MTERICTLTSCSSDLSVLTFKVNIINLGSVTFIEVATEAETTVLHSAVGKVWIFHRIRLEKSQMNLNSLLNQQINHFNAVNFH